MPIENAIHILHKFSHLNFTLMTENSVNHITGYRPKQWQSTWRLFFSLLETRWPCVITVCSALEVALILEGSPQLNFGFIQTQLLHHNLGLHLLFGQGCNGTCMHSSTNGMNIDRISLLVWSELMYKNNHHLIMGPTCNNKLNVDRVLLLVCMASTSM